MQPVPGCNGSSSSSSSSSSREGNSGTRSSSGGGSRRCNGWPLLLFTLLAVTVTAAAAASAAASSSSISASASASGGNKSGSQQLKAPVQQQQQPAMHSLYHEIPRLKLYKACGLPLVLLLARKCLRRGGVYLMENDPRFAFMAAKERERRNSTRTAIDHLKLDKVSASAKHLCFRRNYGLKNPFQECCCNYCTERTVLGYCRDRFGIRRPLHLAPRPASTGRGK